MRGTSGSPAFVANDFTHQPVMLAECLSWLDLRDDALLVDGTVGGGGHAAAILERIGPGGRLIGLDVDRDALDAAAQRLARFGDRVRLVHASFRSLRTLLPSLGVTSVDGVLLDLGVSSHQLDTPGRGFRFADASADTTPLDMRMDQSGSRTAANWLQSATEQELHACFRDYGDLRGARRLARTIVESRREAPIATAADLLALIRRARVGGGRRHNPATLVFQALRIVVNDELGSLSEGLEGAVDVLSTGGRLVVLAYHSAEDRIVKNQLRDEARGCICPPQVPICVCGHQVRLRVLTRRPVRPEDDETRANPRARSARLRAALRLAEAA